MSDRAYLTYPFNAALNAVKGLLRARPERAAAGALYESVVRQARTPSLYTRFGVPDTLDGRFEMIVLHMWLVLRRLKEDAAARERVGDALFAAMFKNMDESLREIGVGDLTVGKKIKQMAEAFFGRIAVYEQAFEDAQAEAAFRDALARNVFIGADASADPEALAEYARAQDAALAAQPVSRIANGVVQFRAPSVVNGS